MSTRRKVGDWVWLVPGAGFVGEARSHLVSSPHAPPLLKVEIRGDNGPWPCTLNCGDSRCREWATLWTEANDSGRRRALYHVSECEILDEPPAQPGS